MKALILFADGFEDSEFFYPYYRLKEAGLDVDVAAPEKGPVTGKHGYSFEANLAFADVQADGYDLLVLPGGSGPETVRLDDNAVKAAKAMLDAGKPVASICHGIQTLISAGALSGRKATCWQGVKDDLKTAGAEFRDEEVVVDGNLVTSRHPGDLPAFGREIMNQVSA
jgi:protease I